MISGHVIIYGVFSNKRKLYYYDRRAHESITENRKRVEGLMVTLATAEWRYALIFVSAQHKVKRIATILTIFVPASHVVPDSNGRTKQLFYSQILTPDKTKRSQNDS